MQTVKNFTIIIQMQVTCTLPCIVIKKEEVRIIVLELILHGL